MMWAYPDSKRFFKGFLTFLIFIVLSFYIHSEYISWSKVSGNENFIGTSYILKNFIILISIILLFFYLKKPVEKEYPKIKVKGEEKIYTKKNKEDYFDKFRKKDELKTKAEKLLERDD